MPIIIEDNKVLIRDGKVALSTDCCCCLESQAEKAVPIRYVLTYTKLGRIGQSAAAAIVRSRIANASFLCAGVDHGPAAENETVEWNDEKCQPQGELSSVATSYRTVEGSTNLPEPATYEELPSSVDWTVKVGNVCSFVVPRRGTATIHYRPNTEVRYWTGQKDPDTGQEIVSDRQYYKWSAATFEYSLDGGNTWTTVTTTDQPHTITIQIP